MLVDFGRKPTTRIALNELKGQPAVRNLPEAGNP